MEKKYEVLADLFENEEFVKAIEGLSPEATVKTLKEKYQLDFSIEELTEFSKGIQKALEEEMDGELTEESLENVAGGGIILWYVTYRLVKNKKVRNAVKDFVHGFLDSM